MVKSLLAALAVVLLGAGVSACGGASTDAHPASSSVASNSTTDSTTAPAPADTKTDGDRDNDIIGAPYDDKNNNRDLNFGHAASAAEQMAIMALVKRYYATALAGDSAKACSIIYSTLAEAVPEDYGQPPGPLYMRGAKTCPTALTLFFKHFHAQLEVGSPISR